MTEATGKIPGVSQMMDLFRAAGSSHPDFFGYPTVEGGLFLQQDPTEFAQFVHFMATERRTADLSLDLGIASGGQTKFLRDWFKCKRTIILDNGAHPMFPHWSRIKPTVDSDICLELTNDSHAPEVRAAPEPYRNQVDFAFVDGDHSYRGLRQDIFLVKPLLKDYGVMALHDTAAVWDCKQVFDDLLRSRDFTLLRNFDNRFGISLWLRLPRRKPGKWYNHRYGWGRL